MEILKLYGSAYEIGLQHGEKLKDLIGTAIEKHRIALEKKARLSSKGLVKRAQAIRQQFPELVEEMEGIAEGASLLFHDVVSYNLGEFPEACSNIAFAGKHESMLGHVNDDVSKGVFDVAFHVSLEGGKEIKHIGVAGSVGTSAALNSDGLAMSHACARGSGFVNKDAVLNLPLFRRALIKTCNSCEDAEAFIREQSFASGADNIICMDKSQNAFVAEKLPADVAFRYPEKGAIYCTGRTLTHRIRKLTGQNDHEKRDAKEGEIIKRERFLNTAISVNNSDFSVGMTKNILLEEDEGVWNELSNWAAILFPLDFEMIFSTCLTKDWEFL
jgi:isopenicillin-N N-acyltransferase-like protein